MTGFELPIIMNVPVEKEGELNKRISTDISYTKLKEQIIRKNFHNLKSNLRKVADYISLKFAEELSYDEMFKELGITKESIKQEVAKLNFWSEYPLQMIPVPKKKEWIKSCLKDPEDTEKYLKRKSRTIASMEQVYQNTETRIKIKQKPKQKIKTEQKTKTKKIEEKDEE